MKKYPYVFLGIFITIFIFVVIHMISIPIKMNRTIKVKEIDNFYTGMETIQEKIYTVKNEDCQNSLLDMHDRIKRTYYFDDISLKYYYENYFVEDVPFNAYYQNVLDKCELENKTTIYNKVLESMVFPYEMKNKYLGSYQISIPDLFVLDKEEKITEELGTYSNKHLELDVLKDLINEVSK